MAEDPTPGPQPPSDDLPRPDRRPDRTPSLPAPAAVQPRPALVAPRPEVDLEAARVREPPVDLVRNPGHIYVTVEMPGASRETIDVEATDRRPTVQARGPDGFVYRREIDLPEAVDPESVQASYRNGVLDITIPLRQSQPAENRSGEDHA